MILLDSDHLSILKYSNTSTFSRLAGRMADSVDQELRQLRFRLKNLSRQSSLLITSPTIGSTADFINSTNSASMNW